MACIGPLPTMLLMRAGLFLCVHARQRDKPSVYASRLPHMHMLGTAQNEAGKLCRHTRRIRTTCCSAADDHQLFPVRIVPQDANPPLQLIWARRGPLAEVALGYTGH